MKSNSRWLYYLQNLLGFKNLFFRVSAWELRGAVTAATATVAAATGQGAHISYDNDNANDSSESPGSSAQGRGGWDGHLLCFDLVAWQIDISIADVAARGHRYPSRRETNWSYLPRSWRLGFISKKLMSGS